MENLTNCRNRKFVEKKIKGKNCAEDKYDEMSDEGRI